MSENFDFISLGKRIRDLRGKESRVNFAESFLIAPSSLARWEAGESQPDMGFLIRLVSAYGLSLEWLITGEGENFEGGRIQADEQLRYLDKIDWTKTKNEKTPVCNNMGPTFGEIRELECEVRGLYKDKVRLLEEVASLKERNRQLEEQLTQAVSALNANNAGMIKSKAVDKAG